MEKISENKINQISVEQQKGFHFFYIFPVLYVVSVYLLPFFLFIVEEDSALSNLWILPILLGVINIVVSIKFCRPKYRIMLLNVAVLMKYALIPFFLFGGFVVLASFLLSFIPVPFMIFMGPVIGILGSIGGWLILAFESPYVISYLRLASKEEIYSKRLTIVQMILQFFFTLDVIDIMFIAFREHRWRKLTIALVVLLILAVILFLAFCAMGIFSVFLGN